MKTKDTNKIIFQKFFTIFFLSLIVYLVVRHFSEASKKEEIKLSNLNFKFFFDSNIDDEIKIKTKIEKIKENLDRSDLNPIYFGEGIDLFRFGINNQTDRFHIDNINIQKKFELDSTSKIVLKEYIDDILNSKDIFFVLEKDRDIRRDVYVRDFFNIKTGTDKKCFLKDKFKKNDNYKICILKTDDNDNKIISLLDFNDIDVYDDELSSLSIQNDKYNDLIKTRLNKNKSQKNNFFYIKEKNFESLNPIQIFVDDSGELPIQWFDKLNWNYFFYWGYIWNVFIILIGSILNFFSSIFSYGVTGYFFGNLGLGIVLTTIFIRTLLWPIYTKSSTFSMNMNLMKPEINKINEKYLLKKDRESLYKKQMEIQKIYQKHNLNIFSFFITFLQIPIFIAMFKTLNRFRVPGGIFESYVDLKKPFLGFINLSSSSTSFTEKNFINIDILVRICLSFLVGTSMFILNKINEKKNIQFNKNVKILSDEQKIKDRNQKFSIKIIGYIMILFMVVASFNDSSLSLYWIVGNIYTILQVIINHKLMKKKYILLKQKNIQ
ncbi:MAG: membrane protein insertase YidC [Candidatus Phytoplasma stylosanthis]|uniref:YidC/Oxa1 family membrane protein insertase n=1 Tax=Candidatus Phytoplasma stylosanthis TaxID=2798314 RepID=UPI00293A9B20|nr:membrane protein insertase YidC [Candidatus Phytoplasma stylosanthis]MDV3168084.1 membrane protein insertase YidC [Candidatus Phytoplasma stylosanthis]MDV3170678.1 membrane protein insertase YidC [Candidatus Phytoplasma stylosanthis]MDV3173891.1 membrane protein insertase YidC [Candidatus Phytoplasma stylosanthis]MDV3174351.1 membrane protein insertase YidC [Candidatus Phytoplasma stylosanthis]MDV3202466.1 membrane protein insertase YidC [Candidatus Phytoplasma stylosanthis]